MASSGQAVRWKDANEYCEYCKWEGDVEITVDPEVFAKYWTCPNCGHEHEDVFSIHRGAE